MRLRNLLARTAVALCPVVLIRCADPAELEPDPETAAQGEGGPRRRRIIYRRRQKRRCAMSACGRRQRRAVPIRLGVLSATGSAHWARFLVSLTACARSHLVTRSPATGHAQAPPEQHNIQISFAESARAMMLTGGPWDPAPSLVYCRGL